MNLRRHRCIMALLVLACGSTAVEAAVNRCVDAQGNVSYTDKPCAANAKQSEVEIQVSRPSTPPATPGADRDLYAAVGLPTTRAECSKKPHEPCYAEACVRAKENPSDSNLRGCAEVRGLRTTRLWIQLSSDVPLENGAVHIQVKCIGIDAQTWGAGADGSLDINVVTKDMFGNRTRKVGRYFDGRDGPDFATWQEAADKLCDIRTRTLPPQQSREERMRGAEMVDAACGGRSPEARKLLAARVSPNSRSFEHDFTGLHCAALLGDIELMRDLKARGASLDAVATDFGLQPIHAAAMSGNLQSVQELVRLGASINSPSLAGTPVLLAFGAGYRLLPERLKEQLPKETEARVRNPYKTNHSAALPEFVKLGARTGGVTDVGEDLLMMAVQASDLEMARTLLAAKANPNARDNRGLSALHMSMVYGARAKGAPKDMTLLLLDHGADINIRDAEGKTIQCSAFRDQDWLIMLFKRGLDPNTVDNEGRSCWWDMQRMYAPGTAAKFFGQIPDLRTPLRADGKPGAGPLYSCVANNDADCVAYLLNRGLKPVDVGAGKQTLMHAVARNTGGAMDHDARRRAIAQALVRAGAKMNEYDENGETPLMVARVHEQPFIVFLIGQGADVNAVNKRSGKSVLDMYTEFRKTDVVAALKAKGARSAGGSQHAR